MSSSGCQQAECSSRTWSSAWREIRSFWRWQTRHRRLHRKSNCPSVHHHERGSPMKNRKREICTSGSVNNVLCFPFLFRGALDVGATTINEEMKSAAVCAIAELAHAEMSDVVAAAYGNQRLEFGPDYLIPTPFDPRLIERIAPAVAKAAMDSGVATRPLNDIEA